MNSKIRWLFMLTVLWSGAVVAQPETFTLQRCIDYALENNPSLKNAAIETQISKASIGEVRATGLPQINGSVNFTHNLAIQTAFITDFISPVTYQVFLQEGLIESVPNSDGTPIPAAFGTDYTASAGVSVSQLIFDGSYFVALKASNTYKEVAAKEQVKTRIDVIEAVQKAYYAVLVSQENLELLTTNYQRLDSLLNETQALYENGFAEKIDVNRVKIEHNNIKTSLKNSTASLATTIAYLKLQMGMPIQQPMQLEGDLDEIAFEPINLNIDDYNFNNRIEYSILNTNRQLVELDRKRYAVQYIPTISANFNAGYNSGTNNFSDITDFSNSSVWFDYSNWGLTMNLPIFDGLRKSYIIQQKKLQSLQLENTQKQLENSIGLEIQQAKIDLNNAVATLETQSENRALAQEVYEITKIKYQEGIGSNLEVIEADATFKKAEIDYTNALYQALVAKIDLEKALGILEN